MPQNFFSQSLEAAVLSLESDAQKGLSTVQVTERQQKFGFNQLLEKKGVSLFQMLLAQFEDAVVWILIAAAIISGIIGDWLEAAVILVLVLINAILGVLQEFKAEKAMEALKKLATPKATVIRNRDRRKFQDGCYIFIKAGKKL